MSATKELTHKEVQSLLLQLQEVNQATYALTEELEILKGGISADVKRLELKKNQYDKHYPYLKKSENEYDALRKEIDQIKDKIDKNSEKKKKIKTIKEFKAVNKEIEYLVKESAAKENDFLTKSEDLEFKKEKIEKIVTQIQEIEESIKIKTLDFETLSKERQALINEKLKEKEKIEKKLPSTILERFNRIYNNRQHLAIVELKKQVCTGCYIQIPPQNSIDIKKENGISYCPYCSRMLYMAAEDV